MNDIPILISALLLARVVLDVISIAKCNVSYVIELGYLLVFSIAGVALLVQNYSDIWGLLCFGIAIFSLIQFFIKRKRHMQTDQNSATK